MTPHPWQHLFQDYFLSCVTPFFFPSFSFFFPLYIAPRVFPGRKFASPDYAFPNLFLCVGPFFSNFFKVYVLFFQMNGLERPPAGRHFDSWSDPNHLSNGFFFPYRFVGPFSSSGSFFLNSFLSPRQLRADVLRFLSSFFEELLGPELTAHIF